MGRLTIRYHRPFRRPRAERRDNSKKRSALNLANLITDSKKRFAPDHWES
jgi:hypothetical protein